MRGKSVFGDDAEMFRPDRFLEVDAVTRGKMRSTVDLVFGCGRWQCMGRPISMMQLYKVFVEVSGPEMPPVPGEIEGCILWIEVGEGDNCGSILSNMGRDIGVFYQVNPSMKEDCSGLSLGTNYCISTNEIGLGDPGEDESRSTIITPTPTVPGDGPTPTPTQV
jgi:hypothetical protein